MSPFVLIHTQMTGLAWFGHDYSAGFVLANLVPQRTDRNVEKLGGASAASMPIYQCRANEFTLDLRNRMPDKMPDDSNLGRGESRRDQVHLRRLL